MTEIAIASPMLPPRLVVWGGIEKHRHFLNEAGCDGGLELHTTRSITTLSRELAGLAIKADRYPAARELCQSAHQSYVSTAPGMMLHNTLGENCRECRCSFIISWSGIVSV